MGVNFGCHLFVCIFFFCKHLTLPGGDSKYCFSKISLSPKALFIWKKLFLGRRVNFRVESTSASVYMRKKLTPLPELKALARVLII